MYKQEYSIPRNAGFSHSKQVILYNCMGKCGEEKTMGSQNRGEANRSNTSGSLPHSSPYRNKDRGNCGEGRDFKDSDGFQIGYKKQGELYTPKITQQPFGRSQYDEKSQTIRFHGKDNHVRWRTSEESAGWLLNLAIRA